MAIKTLKINNQAQK